MKFAIFWGGRVLRTRKLRGAQTIGAVRVLDQLCVCDPVYGLRLVATLGPCRWFGGEAERAKLVSWFDALERVSRT